MKWYLKKCVNQYAMELQTSHVFDSFTLFNVICIVFGHLSHFISFFYDGHSKNYMHKTVP